MHDLGEGLFGMLKGAITIVQNANTVPQFRLLRKVSRGDRSIAENLLWGLAGGTEPAGTLHKLAEDPPS